VAIVGVPFDSGVSYRPGARFGPSRIRESSRLLRPYNPALQVPVFARQQVAGAGDLAVNPFSIDEAIAAIERGARDLLERARFVLALGGDHIVALPMLRAVSAAHGPVAVVVHFDAYLDTWDTYFGAAYTHGTPFRRAAEEGFLDRTGCLHAGIRGPPYTGADLDQDSELGFQVIAAPRWSRSACPAWWNASPRGSATGRCTSRWTSTCSTRRTRPAPAPRRRAA
jgi:agmatinase